MLSSLKSLIKMINSSLNLIEMIKLSLSSFLNVKRARVNSFSFNATNSLSARINMLSV